ncbi:MAG: hypothetical protein Q6K90_07550, partial [Gloeomargarita sp. HHBFW_bins_162]
TIAKVGENIRVRRFTRYRLGEELTTPAQPTETPEQTAATPEAPSPVAEATPVAESAPTPVAEAAPKKETKSRSKKK